MFRLEAFKKAKKILLYVGKYYEVDTKPIIKEVLKIGKKVFLPVTDPKGKKLIISEISDLESDTELGPYGIYQPDANCKRLMRLDALDLLVMPGIGFDKKGNRLGHGAGYYDRFLKDIPHNVNRIGLAFDFQVPSEDIPILANDIPVTSVITN
jgi:5-formyltetrahydrofolate cyclo-ligase